MERISLSLPLFLLSLLTLSACSGVDIQPGGLYSVREDERTFSVVKVLAYQEGVVHLRSYRNRFKTRPTEIDPEDLTLGRSGDPEGLGMEHLPVAESEFLQLLPELITITTITDEELQGYREWKRTEGGAVGNER